MISDFHIHSSFSTDSDESLENIIKQAIALHMPSICITEHNDYDYPLNNGVVEFLLDVEKYTDTLQELAEKYAHAITVCIGVEQGLMKSVADKADAYPALYPFDFIIGSSHLINGADPYYPEFWENVSEEQGTLQYFESILENIACCHEYDVYGHLDYVIRYTKSKGAGYSYLKYADIIDEILRQLIAKGKGIELNTAGFKYGLNAPNPCVDIIKRYRELGGEIITVGSDAHCFTHLGYDFHKVPDILKSCGFQYYTTFKKRIPQFHKL